MWQLIIGIIASFIIGSIPTSLVVSKLKGIDIRKEGSGNVGATNVLRSVGKLAAIFTLIVDIAKGVIPVTLLAAYFFDAEAPVSADVLKALFGLSAISGHVWSVFLKFRGGKGVATSCGVLAILLPKPFLAGAVVFVTSVVLTKYVSVGSLLMMMTIPVIAALCGTDIVRIILSVTICIIVSYRHKDNIRRLLSGKESKIGGPKKVSI